MIKFMRLDDRYIHGQVATTWVRHVAPEAVVIVDDDIAADPFRQKLLKMAAPKDIPVAFYTEEDGVQRLNVNLAKNQIFVIVGNTKAARAVCLGCHPAELDLGNMGQKEGYTNLLNRLWVSEGDVDNLRAIQEAGVDVYAQMLPNEPKDELPKL